MTEHISDFPTGSLISEVLNGLCKEFHSQEVTLRELRDALAGRIYGMLLLVLALPNIVPIPFPGLSAITGLPLLILSIQQVVNVKTPWLPELVLNRRIKLSHLHTVCAQAFPYLRAVERYVVPRMHWLLWYPVDRVVAIVCVVLSLLIMLPIPFGNALPALSICLFSIAILQRDGLFVIIGLMSAAVSFFVVAGVLGTAVMAVLHFWGLA